MKLNDKETSFISSVIYVKNNQDNIEKFISKLYTILDSNFNKFEIIIVNDGSQDDTISIIQNYANSKINNVFSVINMSFTQGLEKSMSAGLDIAIGDFLIEFDSIDFELEENFVLESFQMILNGNDIVSVITKSRRFTSKIFYFLINKFSKNQYLINSDVIRILSRRAINRVTGLSTIMHYRKALYANSGLKSSKIIKKINISKKHSSLNEDRSEVALTSLIIFTDVAYKFSLFISIVLMFASLVTAVYTLIFYFIERSVEGFTTMMLFLSFSFFGLFLLITLIIKYLSILVNLVFLKQKYLVQSIDKLKGI